jgi:ATP-dependent Clp protease ATP-binding subunit ClpC
MPSGECNLVLKYCEALDEFVRIRVFGETEVRGLLEQARLVDRAGYQRQVVKSCILDHNKELGPSLEEATKQGLNDLEDVLYLLCIDVNPGLEIHQVAIPLPPEAAEAGDAGCEEDGIAPLPRKSEKQIERILVIDRELKKRIVGQDHAIDVVTRAVKKSAVGLRDPRRPIGAFLFVGHVGVGKTELGKAITEYLYGSQSRLIRVDCSEYALPHEYAKLIGSPPGYIGHNEGGYLTEAAKELDEFVVLFDEIEKAHSKMHNILLQLLDEGMITDSKGFKVSFRNALVLMTSNLGVREVESLRGGIGFDWERRQEPTFQEMTHEIQEALKKAFRPEFLNRLDDIITFNTLTAQDSIRIVDLMLQDLARIARRAGVALGFEPSVKRLLADRGYRRESGARELKRTIKRCVEVPLTDLLLDGTVTEGMSVRVRVQRGEITFEPVRLATSPTACV